MKKTYNPFKMLGSWVGAVLGTIFSATNLFMLGVFWTLFGSLISFGMCPDRDMGLYFANICRGTYGSIQIIFGMVFPIVLGFLIGWGIHSVIRRIRK